MSEDAGFGHAAEPASATGTASISILEGIIKRFQEELEQAVGQAQEPASKPSQAAEPS